VIDGRKGGAGRAAGRKSRKKGEEGISKAGQELGE
jgi:hypothetical protein